MIVVSTKDWFHCGRDRSPTPWWSSPALRGLWRPFINMLCQNHAQSATSQNSWWSHSLLVILVSGGEWWNKVMLACNFKRKYFQSKGCREFADLVFVFFLLFFFCYSIHRTNHQLIIMLFHNNIWWKYILNLKESIIYNFIDTLHVS